MKICVSNSNIDTANLSKQKTLLTYSICSLLNSHNKISKEDINNNSKIKMIFSKPSLDHRIEEVLICVGSLNLKDIEYLEDLMVEHTFILITKANMHIINNNKAIKRKNKRKKDYLRRNRSNSSKTRDKNQKTLVKSFKIRNILLLTFRIKKNLTKLLYLTLFVFLIWFITLLIPSQAQFKYSLKLARDFPHEVTTSRLGAKFYVSDDILDRMQKNPKQIP